MGYTQHTSLWCVLNTGWVMYSEVRTTSSEKPRLAPLAAESRADAETPKPSSCGGKMGARAGG